MSQQLNPSAELHAIDSPNGMLRVRFNWLGDRYGHVVDLIDGNDTRVLLESVEGSEQDIWPSSPPIQSVNISTIASDTENRRVAMLVGAAGTSHWSMCVAICDRTSIPRDHAQFAGGFPDMPAEGKNPESGRVVDTELVFDVACRTRQTPEWLGNTYRVLAAPIAVSEKLNCACIPVRPSRCVMVTHSVKLQMDTCSGPLPLLQCRATESTNFAEELPTTIRWRYSLRLLGSTPSDFDQTILRPST